MRLILKQFASWIIRIGFRAVMTVMKISAAIIIKVGADLIIRVVIMRLAYPKPFLKSFKGLIIVLERYKLIREIQLNLF